MLFYPIFEKRMTKYYIPMKMRSKLYVYFFQLWWGFLSSYWMYSLCYLVPVAFRGIVIIINYFRCDVLLHTSSSSFPICEKLTTKKNHVFGPFNKDVCIHRYGSLSISCLWPYKGVWWYVYVCKTPHKRINVRVHILQGPTTTPSPTGGHKACTFRWK